MRAAMLFFCLIICRQRCQRSCHVIVCFVYLVATPPAGFSPFSIAIIAADAALPFAADLMPLLFAIACLSSILITASTLIFAAVTPLFHTLACYHADF